MTRIETFEHTRARRGGAAGTTRRAGRTNQICDSIQRHFNHSFLSVLTLRAMSTGTLCSLASNASP
jgi:hypothetical protein